MTHYGENVALILLMMTTTVKRYWDEEGFREVVTGMSFGEAQSKLLEVDREGAKHQ